MYVLVGAGTHSWGSNNCTEFAAVQAARGDSVEKSRLKGWITEIRYSQVVDIGDAPPKVGKKRYILYNTYTNLELIVYNHTYFWSIGMVF